MNKINMILLLLTVSNFLPEQQISAGNGNGAALAGGLIGGTILGSAIASASRPRREVVYVEQQPYQPSRRISNLELQKTRTGIN